MGLEGGIASPGKDPLPARCCLPFRSCSSFWQERERDSSALKPPCQAPVQNRQQFPFINSTKLPPPALHSEPYLSPGSLSLPPDKAPQLQVGQPSWRLLFPSCLNPFMSVILPLEAFFPLPSLTHPIMISSHPVHRSKLSSTALFLKREFNAHGMEVPLLNFSGSCGSEYFMYVTWVFPTWMLLSLCFLSPLSSTGVPNPWAIAWYQAMAF